MWLFTGADYLHPERAILMLAVPVIAFLFWWVARLRARDLALFFDGFLTHDLVTERSPLLATFKMLLLCLTWIMATLAIMYPYVEAPTAHSAPIAMHSRQKLSHDVIFLIDVSASMGVADGRSKESRLTVAKQVADNLLTQLQGESVALYTFTSQLIPEVPLTLDYVFLRLMLRQLALNEENSAGTDFLTTLEALKLKYWSEAAPAAKVFSLVIFSDGGDTEYESLTGEAQSERLEAITNVLQDVHDLQVITVGVGSQQGGYVPDVVVEGKPVVSTMNPTLLESLKTPTGSFITTQDASAFETSRQIATLIAKQNDQRAWQPAAPAPMRDETPPEPLYHIPLTVAILSLLAALLLPEVEDHRRRAK